VKRVLVDTGPLVAMLSANDQYHAVCVETLKVIPAPLLSCWPVVTEAMWLLRNYPFAAQQLLESISSGFLRLLTIADSEAKELAGVMRKYEELHPQLADAALVYLANREGIETIYTLDRRDFSVYRSARKRPFRLLPNLR
jgi:predicted nucleic acid-binding protein